MRAVEPGERALGHAGDRGTDSSGTDVGCQDEPTTVTLRPQVGQGSRQQR
jgi:hypothetical protein